MKKTAVPGGFRTICRGSRP